VSPTSSEGAFVDEVLRVNSRYLDEVVQAFDFCPYARGAREAEQVARTVILDGEPGAATAAALEAIASHAARTETVIGLLIFPRLAVDPDGFDRFVNGVRQEEAKREAPQFALAAFHPDGVYGIDTPARLVMLLRRSPDPTIQLVRFSALQAVKGGQPANKKFLFQWNASAFAELDKRAEQRSPSEKIAQANFETVAREGEARIRAVLDDIRADRDRSYAKYR
jgi:hypothetical protein